MAMKESVANPKLRRSMLNDEWIEEGRGRYFVVLLSVVDHFRREDSARLTSAKAGHRLETLDNNNNGGGVGGDGGGALTLSPVSSPFPSFRAEPGYYPPSGRERGDEGGRTGERGLGQKGTGRG